MGLFSRKKDGKSKKKSSQDESDQQPVKPAWTDGWIRASVEPEEVHELVKGCTIEIKKRGTSRRCLDPRAWELINKSAAPATSHCLRPCWS